MTVANLMPVASLVRVTVAPGMTPPVLSVTLPMTRDVVPLGEPQGWDEQTDYDGQNALLHDDLHKKWVATDVGYGDQSVSAMYWAWTAAPSRAASGLRITDTGMVATRSAIGSLARNASMNIPDSSAGKIFGAIPPPI